MDYLNYRTRGNARPDRKPRVYLTCHPEDAGRWLDPTIADIHAASDCAIFYAANMTSDLSDADWELDLGRMQLFVVPVTFKLLSGPSRAMDVDIPFALERRIPVLPIMVEPGLNRLYARRFGEIQYLSPAGDGRGGGVAYAERLKQYLESVLIGEKEAQRIRKAFDAYVFLSYRKVDRRLADDLMRTVHVDPRCRDIAIWYDEFLTPGESFRANIDRALSDSRLFALLVTPNVLEKPGGQPNFVMGVEYPAAKNAGLEVVAAEAKATDAAELASGFEGLPATYPLWDEGSKARLIDAIARCATKENDNDPLHTYLVGLAYLKGIDVEHDAQRGVELITAAAEAGLLEAMKRLSIMFHEGDSVKLDYAKAVAWAEKLYDGCKAILGKTDPATLESVNYLVRSYADLGNFKKAAELGQEAWDLCCDTLGIMHPTAITILITLSASYDNLGDHEQAARLASDARVIALEVLGENDPTYIASVHNLAHCVAGLGEIQEAIIYEEEALKLSREALGESHPYTLTFLHYLALLYSDKLGDHKKAAELTEKAWNLRREVLGENHPDTLASLSNLANLRARLGDPRKAAELAQEAWRLSRKALGEADPITISALNTLSASCADLGDYKSVAIVEEKLWRLRRDTLGATHPETLASFANLANRYASAGDYRKAKEIAEEAWRLNCEVRGENHPASIACLNNLAMCYARLGDTSKAVELLEQALPKCRKVFGETDPRTLATLRNLTGFHIKLGNLERAAELKSGMKG